jgi:two-component system, NarL family, invasion response regulator UvrY
MKVLLADDHSVVRKGLILLMREEFEIFEAIEVSSSTCVLTEARKNNLNLILLDISLHGRNGIETLKQIRSEGIATPILMLSMHPEEQYALRAMKAGASGFLNKASADEELMVAVHRVLDGRKYISGPIADKLAGSINDKRMSAAHQQLSDREMEVLQLIASGKSLSQIADFISLSANTISTYRSRILEKLSLKNSAEITRYAFDNSLV